VIELKQNRDGVNFVFIAAVSMSKGINSEKETVREQENGD
jgi:hypothetical protein